jgi:polyketide cyclase/dehydrase/lipid transport protein
VSPRPTYRFQATWRVRAAPGDVWDVLYDVPSYPDWWPQVKHVSELIGEETYDVQVRSALPYLLRFTLGQSLADRDAGILEADLRGDLDGFSRYTIREARAGSVLHYEQEVVTTKGLLNLLEPIARPTFVANHWWMMRSGERGLRAFMAGHRFATHGPKGEHHGAGETGPVGASRPPQAAAR